jgi:serine/threonine-protein kinase
MNLIDKILKERYKITEKIESGGMAVVYKGTDLLLVRTVAIKVLKDSFTRDKGVLERFYREARAAAGLSHTNIVSIYDIGREDDLYFIVMEYMSNGTLENLMERKKNFLLKKL